MKLLFFILAALAAGSQCRAQWAVIDAANLTQSIANYAGILQQISNQAQQIQQSQDVLNRLGNMASVTAIVGFPTLQGDQTLPTQMQTWTVNLSGVTGAGLFGDTRNGVYTPVSDHFTDIDGTSVSRDPSLYKPAQGHHRLREQFRGRADGCLRPAHPIASGDRANEHGPAGGDHGSRGDEALGGPERSIWGTGFGGRRGDAERRRSSSEGGRGDRDDRRQGPS